MTIRRGKKDNEEPTKGGNTARNKLMGKKASATSFEEKSADAKQGATARNKLIGKKASCGSLDEKSLDKKEGTKRKPVTLRKGITAKNKEEKEKENEKENKPSAPANENDAMAVICKCLIAYSWYHGVMPREEINGLLQANGDYLIRKTTEKKKAIICLSVRHNEDVRHFPLYFENGTWFLKNMDRTNKFFEVVELVNHLVNEKVQLPPSNAVLIRGVPRPEYYILHDDLVLQAKLGSGAFGEVWKGMLKRSDELGLKTETEVAIKRMKGNPTKTLLAEFVKEAKIMRQFRHRNIVNVYGVAPNEEPLMIVIELAKNGCLKSYLKKTQCSNDQLTQFVTDAARGMCYLSTQLIIHRDLAARNLLLGADLEVKISDFGLSESGKKEVKINKMKLPIRWLAPETIDTGVFTTKTDVWSFAVTMWEIFDRCATDPFPGMTNQQAKEKIRSCTPPMQAPPETPGLIVRLMLDCFEKNPDSRPTFTQILKKINPNEDVAVFEADYEQKTQRLDVGSMQESPSQAAPSLTPSTIPSAGNLSVTPTKKKPTTTNAPTTSPRKRLPSTGPSTGGQSSENSQLAKTQALSSTQPVSKPKVPNTKTVMKGALSVPIYKPK